MNQECPSVQCGFRKDGGIRDQIANILWMREKSRELQKGKKKKNLLHWLLESLYVNHNKLWEIIEEMGILDHLTYLLRNLYAGQEATVRILHGTADWLKIGKGVHQGCILSPACLTYMQSTSCEMTVWMNHKLKPRLPGEIATPQICRWYQSNGRKQRGTKEPFNEDEKGEW